MLLIGINRNLVKRILVRVVTVDCVNEGLSYKVIVDFHIGAGALENLCKNGESVFRKSDIAEIEGFDDTVSCL